MNVMGMVMCCLYSVPNLLVIQYLETLYLGGNNVWVVCERVWRIDQVCALRGISRLTHEWWPAKMWHTCRACRKLKGQDSWITIGKKVQSGHFVIWRLELTTHPSHKWLSSAPCFAKKWLFTFHLIPYYKYPYTHKM